MEYPKVYAVDFDGTLNTAKTYPDVPGGGQVKISD